MNKKIIIPIAVVLVAVSVGLAYALFNTNNESNLPVSTDSPRTAKINFDPPTEPEKAAGDQQKEVLVKDSEASATAATVANVVIVDSAQYDDTIEIRAFISNVFKDGTCTAVLTNGQSKVTKTVTALKDATTTRCSAINIPRSEFALAGNWDMKLIYEAEGVSGQAAGKVEVK